MAKEFGQDPMTVGRWPDRVFRAALQWMRDQWNEPSRSDYYMMLVAMEVARKLARQPGKIQLKHFRIKFAEASQGMDPEKAKKFASELSRARLMAMVEAARRKKERGQGARLKEPTRKRLEREKREREGGNPPKITPARRRPPKPELRAPSPRR